MTGNYISILIHAVWTTKNREWLLTRNIRFDLFSHLKEKSVEKDINIDIINGIEDHVHCLFWLKPTQNVADVIKNLKGESSRWINANNLLAEGKFSWQEGYGAFSVSPPNLERVRNYIYNQEKHHEQMSYDAEMIKLQQVAYKP